MSSNKNKYKKSMLSDALKFAHIMSSFCSFTFKDCIIYINISLKLLQLKTNCIILCM